MMTELNMNLPYTYEFHVTLASDAVKMSEIKKEIDESIDTFNSRSIVARNAKQIYGYEVKDNLLFVRLGSENSMGIPTRGLYLLSQLVMKKLREDKDKNKLVDEIIKNRSFFKGVGEVKEIKNFDTSNEINTNERIGNKDDVSIEELFMTINELKDRIEKIEKVLKI